MRKRGITAVVLPINIVAILIFLVFFINRSFPYVGHDFAYFIPRLIDTHLHYQINGVEIQWYTPSFGGGLPAYPNPQHIQFSLPQFLTELINPWVAALASIAIFAMIGYCFTYYFFRCILSLHWTASALGALFFVANGFFIEHMAAGHLPYQTFPLLTVIIVALFAPTLSPLAAGIVISLVLSVLIHEAGFYLTVVFALSLWISLPILYLICPSIFKWKRLLISLTIGVVFTLMLTGSKIFAVYSFLRFFPREMYDHYDVSLIQGLAGLLMQLAGTMTAAPLYRLLGIDVNLFPYLLKYLTGSPYGIWELDVSLSPVLLGILYVGAIKYAVNRRNRPRTPLETRQWIAIGLLALAIWVTAEFALARGFLYPLLRNLPFMRSMHVNVRFASAFIFPLSMLGAILVDRWAHSRSSTKTVAVYLVLNLLSLAALAAYFLYSEDVQERAYDITTALNTYQAIQQGNTFPVERIARVSDTDAFLQQASSLLPYEPIFGYSLEDFAPEVRQGSVSEINNGYFNMTDPTGFVFPEVNHTRPFERIAVEEKNAFETFIRRGQPDWKIPLAQKILNWLSIVTLIMELSLAGFWFSRKHLRI